MVSLVILAVGMLGMAALHGLGAKFGNKAYFRSQAITQAYDLIDRMRSNPAGVSAHDYIQSPLPSGFTSDCGISACTALDLATYDLVTWDSRNGAILPEGAGAVTVDDADITVLVNWVEDSNGDGVADISSISVTTRI